MRAPLQWLLPFTRRALFSGVLSDPAFHNWNHLLCCYTLARNHLAHFTNFRFVVNCGPRLSACVCYQVLFCCVELCVRGEAVITGHLRLSSMR